MKDFPGSDVIDKMGWNQDSILELFSNFLCENNLEDSWINYLNNKADQELSELDYEE